MSEGVKVNVKVSSEVNTILHDLFNQIQYELCEQYEDEIERLNNIIKEVKEYVEKAQERDEDKESCSLYVPKLLEILNKGESND